MASESRIESVEPEVSKFAKVGRQAWRQTEGIDVDKLAATPGVQKQLKALGSDVEIDADAIRDAIEAALLAAIETLPDPYRSAGLDEFGFSNTEANRTERAKLAARHFQRTDRWYRLSSREYGGRSPQAHIIWLVSRALMTPRSPWSSRRWQAVGAAAVLGVIALGVYLADSLKGSPEHQARAVTTKSVITSTAAVARGGFVPANRPIFRCIRRPECPGPEYPVFNSYMNAPNYGDERDFLNVRPVSGGPFENRLSVSPGQELLLRIYYDNDGDTRSEPVYGSSTARGTRVSVLLPHARANRLTVAANITASNTDPSTIGDTVALESPQPVNIIYMPGTALLKNRAHPMGAALSKRLLGGGALIGYEQLNGEVTGCFCQSGFITLRLLIE